MNFSYASQQTTSIKIKDPKPLILFRNNSQIPKEPLQEDQNSHLNSNPNDSPTNNNFKPQFTFGQKNFFNFPKSQPKVTFEKEEDQRKRIEKIDKELNDFHDNHKYTSEMQENLLKYHKDPHLYIDFLLEKYFQYGIINSDSDKVIQEKIRKDYETFVESLAKKFGEFTKKQKAQLDKLRDEIEKRILKKKNKKKKEGEEEFQTEPIYEGESISKIFAETPTEKYNMIINSNKDQKMDLINDKGSAYHYDKLSKKALESLKERKINVPERQFLTVNDVKLDSNEVFNQRRFFNVKKESEENKRIREERDYQNRLKTVEMQKRIFDEVYNKNLANIEKVDNEEYFEFLFYLRDKMLGLDMFDKLTISNLKILLNENEEIRRLLSEFLKKKGELSYKERKEQINKEEKMQDCLVNVCVDLNQKKPKELTDEEIDALYMQQLNKGNGFGPRIYYNDNPYHYHYNYTGCSIDIKKKLYNGKPKPKKKPKKFS